MGRPGRRQWTAEQKQWIVEETRAPGASVSVVARRYDINANLLFKWKRLAEAGQLGGSLATTGSAEFVPIGVVGRAGDGGAALLARVPDAETRMPSGRSSCRQAGCVLVEGVMASATASLPSDPEALRALAIALQEALATKDRELAARDAEIYAKTLHIEKLRATLALMKRARFGRSSERIEQLELLISDLEEEAAAQQARRDAAGDRRPSKAGERRARGRQPLPAYLPRERVVHEPRVPAPRAAAPR